MRELGRQASAGATQPIWPARGGRDPVPRPADAAAEKRSPRIIRLSIPEVRKLLFMLVWDRLAREEQTLAWSDWRRDCSGRLGANRIHGVRFLRGCGNSTG